MDSTGDEPEAWSRIGSHLRCARHVYELWSGDLCQRRAVAGASRGGVSRGAPRNGGEKMPVVDAGLAGLLGVAVGSAITGGLAFSNTIVSNNFQRDQARTQRQHDNAENVMQRDHERQQRTTELDHQWRSALHVERAERVREWREGLAAAFAEHDEWLHWINEQPAESGAHLNPRIPNAAGTAWFQSLRPLISEDGYAADYRNVSELLCDSGVVVALTFEIDRIEREWLDEAKG
jgi:hypothetical protein